jgi:NAD(P)H-quinone oxidoreductase subunit 6
MSSGIGTIIFLALAGLTLAGGAFVAFSRNIVHSAFALLATFFGVAGLYATLAADFVAVIQVLVYVGGILILILFSVMLTNRISEAKVSNASLGFLPALVAMAAMTGLLAYSAFAAPWAVHAPASTEPATQLIGDALLGPYVLPFEVVSILLFAALLGAVTLAKAPGKKRRLSNNAAEGKSK